MDLGSAKAYSIEDLSKEGVEDSGKQDLIKQT